MRAPKHEPPHPRVLLKRNRALREARRLLRPVIYRRQEPITEALRLRPRLLAQMMPVPRQDTLDARKRLRDELLVEREEARERRGEVVDVVEPDDAAVDRDTFRVLQLDVEATAEVQALEEQRALPLEPEDRGAVVYRDVRAVATSAATAEERTAGAYGL